MNYFVATDFNPLMGMHLFVGMDSLMEMNPLKLCDTDVKVP